LIVACSSTGPSSSSHLHHLKQPPLVLLQRSVLLASTLLQGVHALLQRLQLL
jgi:hypothetical protein